MSVHRSFAPSLALVSLIGCAAEPAAEFDKTYNVIAVVPLSGSFAGKGTEHLKAIQLGFDAVDAAGGVDRPIRVFPIDAANNDAVLVAERLAAQIDTLTVEGERHVTAIISSTSGAQKGAAPIALAQKIPYFEISSGSGLDEVPLADTDDRSFAFAPRPLCMPETAMTGRFLAERAITEGWGRVMMMRGSLAHDRMHTREVRNTLAALGSQAMIANADDIEMANTGPFESYIDTAIAANAQVIYYHITGDTLNLAFLQAAERRGFTGKIVSCGMARSVALLHSTEAIARYLSGGTVHEGRMYFMMRGPVASPSYDAFQLDFLRFAGVPSDSFSPAGYDAAVLIGLALAQAGTDDGATLRDAIQAASVGGKQFLYGSLHEALAAAKAGEDIDYDGASGDLNLRLDPVLGRIAVGRYYVDTVIRGTGYEYQELAEPTEVR